MRLWSRRFPSFAFFLTIACALAPLSGCVSAIPASFGLEKDYEAQVPARIAVLPCRLWPQGALFPGQVATTLETQALAALCDLYDQFVLSGFDGQPLMRGISPKLVQALLGKASQPQLLARLEDLWFRPAQACEACQHPTTYYKKVIAPRDDWRSWLITFSRATTNCDAILMPFIVSASEGLSDEKGIRSARRSESIALLLVDTNNGQLIWSGGREADASAPFAQDGAKPIEKSAFPSWGEVSKRVLADELWAGFPGRQK